MSRYSRYRVDRPGYVSASAAASGGAGEGSGYPLNFLNTADAQGDGTTVAVYDMAYSTLLDAPAGSPATDTGAVGSVSDLSGNEAAADQSTAGARPTLAATGFGGGPCITFDGGDYLQLAAWAGGAELQPYTVVVIGSLGADSAGQCFVAAGAGLQFVLDAPGATWRVYAGGSVNFGTRDTSPHVLIGLANGASSAGYEDGTETTGNASVSGINGITIGAFQDASNKLTSGSKVAAVAVYSGDIGATARAYILAAAQARWSNL